MNILMKRKKLIHLILCLGVLVTTLFLVSKPTYIRATVYNYLFPRESISCYRAKRDSLPQISDFNPRKGQSIFFHETSCNSYFNNKITISARQACAVESAAKMNPNMDVYLLFTSPGNINFEGDESDRILQALHNYKNIRIMHLNFERYIKGTILEELYLSGMMENSDFARSHASDVLRYLTLWKYGGIYLDLDVIVIKPLKDLMTNYAGAESEENVAAGVLSFSPSDHGHALAESCLNDLKNHFNGHEWGNNGPGVITRLLKTICNVKNAKEMITKGCDGFTVYPETYFYPIHWWNWKMYFDSKETENVLNRTKSSYAVHVWNKHSSSMKIPKTTRAAYLIFAEQYCPQVVTECLDSF